MEVRRGAAVVSEKCVEEWAEHAPLGGPGVHGQGGGDLLANPDMFVCGVLESPKSRCIMWCSCIIKITRDTNVLLRVNSLFTLNPVARYTHCIMGAKHPGNSSPTTTTPPPYS